MGSVALSVPQEDERDEGEAMQDERDEGEGEAMQDERDEGEGEAMQDECEGPREDEAEQVVGVDRTWEIPLGRSSTPLLVGLWGMLPSSSGGCCRLRDTLLLCLDCNPFTLSFMVQRVLAKGARLAGCTQVKGAPPGM